MKNLIRELQTKVASMPVNHLGALSVDEFCNMLNVYDKEDVIAFIDMLNKECVLQYKYKFICDCGERNIAYQHKLDHEKYVWNEKSGLGETATVRDNVLFEYGLFMGAKGKKCLHSTERKNKINI